MSGYIYIYRVQDLWGALTLEVRVTPEAPITTTPGPPLPSITLPSMFICAPPDT